MVESEGMDSTFWCVKTSLSGVEGEKSLLCMRYDTIAQIRPVYYARAVELFVKS